MSLYMECQYLKMTVPGVGSLMGSIDDDIRVELLPELYEGEEVRSDLREILGHSVKCRGLGIQDPQMSAERVYNTSKSASEILLVSLLGSTDFNYVSHKGCTCRASADGRKHWEFSEKAVLTRRKDLTDRRN